MMSPCRRSFKAHVVTAIMVLAQTIAMAQADCIAHAGPGFPALSFYGYGVDDKGTTGVPGDSEESWNSAVLGAGSYTSVIEMAAGFDRDRLYLLDSRTNQILLYAPQQSDTPGAGTGGTVFYPNPHPELPIYHVTAARNTFAVSWTVKEGEKNPVLGLFARATGESLKEIILDRVDVRNFNAIQSVSDSVIVFADSKQPVMGSFDLTQGVVSVRRVLQTGRVTSMTFNEIAGELYTVDEQGNLNIDRIDDIGAYASQKLPSEITLPISRLKYIGNNEVTMSGPDQAVVVYNIRSQTVTARTFSDAPNAIHALCKCPAGGQHGFGYTLTESSTAFTESASVSAYRESLEATSSGKDGTGRVVTAVVIGVVVVLVGISGLVGFLIYKKKRTKEGEEGRQELGRESQASLASGSLTWTGDASDAYLVKEDTGGTGRRPRLSPFTSQTNTPLRTPQPSVDTRINSLQDMQVSLASQVSEARSSNTSASRTATGYRQITLGEIELGSRLGRGGFANVYKGSWNGLDVAVKVLKDVNGQDILGAFRKEMDVLCKLRHPNIVLLLGADVSDDGHVTIVTELKEGGSLFDVLDRCRRQGTPLPLSKAWRYALDVALGMLYLHSDNPSIIHRDLKSANILLDGNGRASVADFGLSKVYDGNAPTAPVGTPAWMAPELMTQYTTRSDSPPPGEHSLKKMDVYSYGVVLWELATSLIPWDDLSLETLFCNLAQAPNTTRLAIPSWLPEVWATLIHRCFAGTPLERPFFRDIVRYLKEHETEMTQDIGIDGIAGEGGEVGGGGALIPGTAAAGFALHADRMLSNHSDSSEHGLSSLSRSAVTVSDLRNFLSNVLGPQLGRKGEGEPTGHADSIGGDGPQPSRAMLA